MSARLSIIPACAVYDPRLRAADVRVLTAFGTYADKNGRCYPSQATIAQRLGVTLRAVAEHVAKLKQLGYLEVKPRRHPDGRARSAEYRVAYEGEPPVEQPRRPTGTGNVAPRHMKPSFIRSTPDHMKPSFTSRDEAQLHPNDTRRNALPSEHSMGKCQLYGSSNGESECSDGAGAPSSDPIGSLPPGRSENDVPAPKLDRDPLRRESKKDLRSESSDEHRGEAKRREGNGEDSAPAGEVVAPHPSPNLGADAPVINLAALLYSREPGCALAYLMGRGLAERNARSLIGRWRREIGDAPLLEILASASAKRVEDPVEYVTGAVRRRRRERDRNRDCVGVL